MNAGACCFRSTPRLVAVAMAAVIGLCLAATQTHAHKVNVFAYVEGDRVVIEGYFSASVKARDCPVQVFDDGGRKIREGQTDQKGGYSFKLADLPAFSGGLTIVLEGGMGHKAEYTLSASDLPGSVKTEAPPMDQPQHTKLEPVPGPEVAGSARVVDEVAVAAALETALDKKLEPIVRMLGAQEKLLLEQKHAGPTMTEIVGGIGWIMGLVGIAAFFAARNRSSRRSSD